MLTVDDYAKIRLAHRDGMSIREIARTFHHSRRKVRQILAHAAAQALHAHASRRPRPCSALSRRHRRHPGRRRGRPAQAAAHRHADLPPPARRARLRRRLRPGPPLRRQAAPRPARDVHPAGPRSGPAARGRLRPHPRRLPRRPPPGAGADRRLGLLQLRRSPWPCPPSAPRPSWPAWSQAFAFFGCVPREVWWDNPTTVVAQIFKGRERRPNASTRPWPATTPSSRCSACRRGATRSRMSG